MAVKMTTAGVIGKWVVAPVLLALLGFFVIGPRIGKTVGESLHGPSQGPPNADPPATGKPPAPANHPAGSDVTVKVTRAAPGSTVVADDGPKPRRHKPRKVQPKSSDVPPSILPAKQEPPQSLQDQGGSAGSTTAG